MRRFAICFIFWRRLPLMCGSPSDSRCSRLTSSVVIFICRLDLAARQDVVDAPRATSARRSTDSSARAIVVEASEASDAAEVGRACAMPGRARSRRPCRRRAASRGAAGSARPCCRGANTFGRFENGDSRDRSSLTALERRRPTELAQDRGERAESRRRSRPARSRRRTCGPLRGGRCDRRRCRRAASARVAREHARNAPNAVAPSRSARSSRRRTSRRRPHPATARSRRACGIL